MSGCSDKASSNFLRHMWSDPRQGGHALHVGCLTSGCSDKASSNFLGHMRSLHRRWMGLLTATNTQMRGDGDVEGGKVNGEF